MSIARRAGSALARFLARLTDPGGETDRFQLYTKEVDSATQLFGQSSDGTVTQLTFPEDFGTGGWFGTGSDGDLNFDGVSNVVSALGGAATFNLAPVANQYTLTRDLYANNMTVANGVSIKTDGWRIFVVGTLTLTGTGKIHSNGGNGGNGNATNGGTAGAAAGASNFMYGGRAGVAGSNATGTGSAGGLPANSHIGSATSTVSDGANGGVLQGGAGGRNELGLQGGTVGTNNVAGVINQSPSFQLMSQALTGAMANFTRLEGGSSGATGRAGSTVASGSSGGSGAGGGTVLVFARRIEGSGSIEAKGGNAGSSAGDAGGSGGGAGGIIVLASSKASFPLSITTSVAGGNGGAAGGGVGTTAGGNGGTGIEYIFQV